MGPSLMRSNGVVKVGSVGIDCFEQGSGPPLLFLHAGEGPTVYGSRYIEELAKHFRVLCPVHPGFGNSERPSHFRSVDDLAYFYLDFARQRQLRDATLVGASFGGWIAAEIAIRSTEHFAHLVLAGALGIKVGGREDRDILDLHAVPTMQWPDYYFVEPEISRPKFEEWQPEDLLAVARSREALTLYGWKPYMHNPNLRQWLHRIDIPGLVVWGRDDRIVSSAYGRAYADGIPGCRMEIIDSAGHFVHVDQPVKFAAAVADFACDAGRISRRTGT